MKKSFITKLVSCALVTTMLAGCGSSAGTAASSKTTSGGTDTAASGDAESITCMIWDRSDAASGTTMEDNPLANWIKEQVLKDCNVNVSYVSVPRSGSDDKLNTMMTGGNAPDVIFTYSQALFGNYTSQGGVADLLLDPTTEDRGLTGQVDQAFEQLRGYLDQLLRRTTGQGFLGCLAGLLDKGQHLGSLARGQRGTASGDNRLGKLAAQRLGGHLGNRHWRLALLVQTRA